MARFAHYDSPGPWHEITARPEDHEQCYAFLPGSKPVQPLSRPSAPASQFTPAATPAGMVGTIPAGAILLARLINRISSHDPQGRIQLAALSATAIKEPSTQPAANN